jgi:glycosyltransferase involved in cell wall biosynthesis
MKIMLVVEQFDPNRGYLEYYLAKELVKLGHKVYILTFEWNKNILRKMTEDGFEIISLPYIGIIHGFHIPYLTGIIYLIGFLKREKLDVIHCQPVFSPISLLLIQLKDLFYYKCVGSLITGEFYLNNLFKKILFKLSIIAVLLIRSKVDRFFALNNNVALYINNTFGIPYKKIEVIPLGADLDLFRYSIIERAFIRKKLGIRSDDIVICYTGRLSPSKQVDILMKALAPIIKNNSKVKLLIVGSSGDDAYLKYLKEYASKLQIQRNVIFHPTVHRKQLSSFYSASDIAVWPAAPSISILEAASVGLPIISGSLFFYKDLEDQKAGYVIRRGDQLRLTQLLSKLIADEKLRRNLGSNAKNLVKTKFNWELIVKKYIKVYSEVLCERSTAE